VSATQCGAAGRFRTCHEPVVNTCQYCGRGFCARHTYFLEGYDAVCTRPRCQHKHDDLARHMVYRQSVAARNAAGLCGVEGCGPHPRTECSLCRGHFCDAHISERMYPFREGRLIIEKPASICAWCWARRKIWRI
jgi:hypothetical protein